MTPTRVLPDSYTKIWSLDLAQDRKKAIVLNLISLPLFAFFAWLFLSVSSILRADITSLVLLRTLSSRLLALYLDFFLIIILFTLIHEGIHGFFFWLTTRTRPVFGVKLLFAYAGAPEWYIPRSRYLVIGLAPIVVMTIAGFAAIPFLPLPLAQVLLFGMVMNAAGAIGDLYVCAVVMRHPPEVLIQDNGFVFEMYGTSQERHAIEVAP